MVGAEAEAQAGAHDWHQSNSSALSSIAAGVDTYQYFYLPKTMIVLGPVSALKAHFNQFKA